MSVSVSMPSSSCAPASTLPRTPPAPSSAAEWMALVIRFTSTTRSARRPMVHGVVMHLSSEGEHTTTRTASLSPKHTRTPGCRCSPCSHTSVPPLQVPRFGQMSKTRGGGGGGGGGGSVGVVRTEEALLESLLRRI